jgi:hypothetical protein
MNIQVSTPIVGVSGILASIVLAAPVAAMPIPMEQSISTTSSLIDEAALVTWRHEQVGADRAAHPWRYVGLVALALHHAAPE